jgi:cysteinyl-tRNA synthetase
VVRRDGAETAFVKGDSFDLDVVRTGGGDPAMAALSPAGQDVPDEEDEGASFWERVRGLEREFEQALAQHEADGAARALLDVDQAVWQASRDLADREVVSQAREVLRDMMVMLGTRLGELPASAESCLEPLVSGMLDLRRAWREAGRWAEADAVRDALQQSGVVVEDTPDGPRWHLG